jgi:RimJ/RimL family protein N-acetyltransferase
MAVLLFPDPPLRASRIRLRPWSELDVPAIVAACQDPTVPRFMPQIPSPYTDADALEWLAGQEPMRLAGGELHLAVASEDTPSVLGAIDVVDVDARSANGEGWLLPRADAHGHGYATRALHMFARWLFEGVELARVELTTDPQNLASQAVAARCGFRQEGYLRSHLLFPRTGKRRDSLLWGLLPDDLTVK